MRITEKMTIYGYIRVSDDDQNEALQRDALNEAGCTKIYCDHGVSGAQTSRPALDELLETLEKNDTLVVWKFDRLGRSTVHLLLLFDELRQRGVRFISTTQGIDTASFEGRIFFGQLALFAEYEREMIRQRTKAGMQAAKRRGKHIGRPRKLSNTQIENLRRRVLSLPYEQRQLIANDYAISIKTLHRIIDTPKAKKVAHV